MSEVINGFNGDAIIEWAKASGVAERLYETGDFDEVEAITTADIVSTNRVGQVRDALKLAASKLVSEKQEAVISAQNELAQAKSVMSLLQPETELLETKDEKWKFYPQSLVFCFGDYEHSLDSDERAPLSFYPYASKLSIGDPRLKRAAPTVLSVVYAAVKKVERTPEERIEDGEKLKDVVIYPKKGITLMSDPRKLHHYHGDFSNLSRFGKTSKNHLGAIIELIGTMDPIEPRV